MSDSERIQAVVARFVERGVAPDESLFDSGLLDSFSLPDMVLALEEELRIKVPDSDLNPRTFDSINSIEAYVKKRR